MNSSKPLEEAEIRAKRSKATGVNEREKTESGGLIRDWRR